MSERFEYHKVYYKRISAILLILIISNLVFSQENKEKILISKKNNIFDSINVLLDSTLFNGYIVFKIHKNPDTLIYKTDNEYYVCDIFWLRNLNLINQDTSYYFYNFYTLIYNQFIINNDYQKNTSTNYLNFKNLFEKHFQTLSDAAYYMIQFLNTNIFKNEKFWNYRSNKKVGYFIYKISLSGSIISVSFSTDNKNNDKEPFIYKIFIPLSKFYIFNEVTDFELQNLGFKESKWYPKNLFGK